MNVHDGEDVRRGREMVTAALHYRVNGVPADLLLYGDLQENLLADLEDEGETVVAVMDDLVTLLTTSFMRMAELGGQDPLSLWSTIALKVAQDDEE